MTEQQQHQNGTIEDRNIDNIDPNSLLTNIGSKNLTLLLIISLALHILILGVTSINYIYIITMP